MMPIQSRKELEQYVTTKSISMKEIPVNPIENYLLNFQDFCKQFENEVELEKLREVY